MVIRVVLADDQPLMLQGLDLLLRSEPDVDVVGLAADGDEALRLAHRHVPDVVVLDVRMPRLDGVAATRRVVDELGGPPAAAHAVGVLVLTAYHDDDTVYAALRAGAQGFVVKDAAPAELVAAIRAVAAGDGWLHPAVARRLLAEFARRSPPGAPPPADLAALTPREREVLVAVAHGLSNADVAAHLVVTEATVKTHLGRVLMKLGLRDRAQAVAVAYRAGLVTATSPLPPRS
ncbi:response regulator [Cellulomonas sp. NPDC057328]|uniref:response regulator n=1 Tax=Cellulomonas sp. NPDC057328 TaxID=3346101 RepID=UPI0036452BF0